MKKILIFFFALFFIGFSSAAINYGYNSDTSPKVVIGDEGYGSTYGNDTFWTNISNTITSLGDVNVDGDLDVQGFTTAEQGGYWAGDGTFDGDIYASNGYYTGGLTLEGVSISSWDDVNFTGSGAEVDPYWTANYSLYNTTWSTDTNTNAETICSTDEVLLGNGTCVSSSSFGGGGSSPWTETSGVVNYDGNANITGSFHIWNSTADEPSNGLRLENPYPISAHTQPKPNSPPIEFSYNNDHGIGGQRPISWLVDATSTESNKRSTFINFKQSYDGGDYFDIMKIVANNGGAVESISGLVVSDGSGYVIDEPAYALSVQSNTSFSCMQITNNKTLDDPGYEGAFFCSDGNDFTNYNCNSEGGDGSYEIRQTNGCQDLDWEIDPDGDMNAYGNVEVTKNITIHELAGAGNAYACLDSNGMLYRSATACV